MAPRTEQQRQASLVLRRLRKAYPDAVCALQFETPFQLLIATILSAQCTDERVNLVTRVLFDKYPTAADLATASIATLEPIVRSTGFFRSKSKNIKECAETLVRDHDGEVPRDLESLVLLPGVGRKTANVVLGTAFGIPSGVVVDTHVGRISRRLGLTEESDPVKVEHDLMRIMGHQHWVDYSHRMIYHGRSVCTARKAKCDECLMHDFCPRIGVVT